MSDSKSILPKMPFDVIMAVMDSLPYGHEIDTEAVAVLILDAFEEHDIDVTWRPAEKAHGTLGGFGDVDNVLNCGTLASTESDVC